MNEREFIRRVARRAGTKTPGLRLGDDAAYFRPRPGFQIVVTIDALVENVHFSRRYAGLRDVGRRLVTCNVSDLAAKGATPLYFLMAVGFPEGVAESDLEQFVDGVAAGCRQYGIQLIGGDTDRTPGPISLTGMAIGEARKPVERRTAEIGHALVVTNDLGGSYCGWAALDTPVSRGWEALKARHLRPDARVREGLILAKAASAMMDLSDGLSSDLTRLAEESGKGMLVRAADIPAHPDALAYCAMRSWDPLEIALKSGEEFELLAAVPKSAVAPLAAEMRRKTGSRLTPIGEVIRRKGVYLEETGEGTRGGKARKVRRPLPETGYEHRL